MKKPTQKPMRPAGRRRQPLGPKTTDRRAVAQTSATDTRRTRRQLREAASAALSKKAQDLVILDVRKLADFCDYFLLCHGSNPQQIAAIAEAIELQLERRTGISPSRRDGSRGGEWIVLDYSDFMVHIFSKRTRSFYDLERLWSAAPRLHLPAVVKE